MEWTSWSRTSLRMVMRMNKTNYKQYDTRWAKLGYPKKPWYIKDCGCGEVAICNCIIEMDKYKNETPKTIQPYCKQYAAPNGNGTYFSGIPAMMKHYGMTEVKEHATMSSLWKELAKGNRVAIYLMGSRKGGSKGVHWTSGGHFVCSVDYKVKNGKHYVYVKDSYSTSELRNGWITYEGNMRNDVSRVWSGKLPAKAAAPTTKKTVDQIAQEVIDGKWGNGDDRVKRLKAAGYDPSAVQKKVNELLAAKTTAAAAAPAAPKVKSAREKIADKAFEFAYQKNSKKAKYPSGKPKAAYKAALYKAYPNLKKLSSQAAKGASCDVFVGTCVRAAGVDKKFPRGLSPSYLAKSKKFKLISKNDVKPGDIIVTPKHICIAWSDGKVKEASNGSSGFWPKTTNTLKKRLNASGAKVYRAK